MPLRSSTRSASVNHISFDLNTFSHRQSKRVSKPSRRVQFDQRQQKERRVEAEAAAAAIEQQRRVDEYRREAGLSHFFYRSLTSASMSAF